VRITFVIGCCSIIFKEVFTNLIDASLYFAADWKV